MTRSLLSLAAAMLLSGCAVAPPPEPALSSADTARLRQAGAEVLFWSQEQRDANFRTMETIFPTRMIRAGGRARPLAQGAPLPVDETMIEEFVESQNIAALIVLQDGRIRLERYARGFTPEQRWTSFSVAKSLTSTLVGAAVRDGHIASLDDPVTRYVPELAGSAYDGVSVRHVLTMSSGVRWNEDYTDPASDVARMFAEPPPEGMDVTVAYLRKLPRAAEPGTRWNYNTAETNLIGVVVSRAVGKPLARYASERIWRPYGMEADAFWQLDERGHEIAGCCISARARDYARIGQFMLDGGRAGRRDVLPAGWVAEATRLHHPVSPRGDGYGYQWWTLDRGYIARGIFGQSIRIDPERRLVMVTLGAWPAASDGPRSIARETFFRHVGARIEQEGR
ncbi:MAG: serine hydrolase domain-containing protein [Allosphingosinicella sp.]|uniref:serine hydrolase domain-containing protein n=1 Tax=Allosphingosinicella sp. TaxID=2823234 RepID=UPI0039593B2A